MTIVAPIKGVSALLCAATMLSVTGTCGRPSTGPIVSEGAVTANSASCPQQTWSTPLPLLTPSTSVAPAARSPAIVTDKQNLYVVGNNVPFNDQAVRVGNTLTAWRVGSGSIGAPAGDFVFIFPKATIDATGRLHALWGEPSTHADTIAPYYWILQQTAQVWSASYDAEHGWSPAALVYSGAIDWNRVSSDAIIGVGDKQRVVAIPNQNGGVIVLALRNGVWNATAIPGRTTPAYVSALDLGDRRLLAMVTADTAQAQDQNSVFLYSQVAGAPWRLLRQIQRSGTQPAMEVRLLQESGGRLHIVWRQMIRQDYFVVRHTSSDDGGESFSSPSDLEPGGLIQSVQAAMDHCGRLHVAYEDWNDGSFNRVKIGYATWLNGWSRPQRVHTAYLATDLALASGTDGSMFLAFWGTNDNPLQREGWAMMYSELR